MALVNETYFREEMRADENWGIDSKYLIQNILFYSRESSLRPLKLEEWETATENSHEM
jgi:hypothetical protein